MQTRLEAPAKEPRNVLGPDGEIHLAGVSRAFARRNTAPVPVEDGPKTTDAANHGQLGNETAKPARQGEAEVGEGGPGVDPNTGELGGQALEPQRRAVGDGFTKPARDPE